MKFLHKKNIFLLIIHIYLIKISLENEQKQLERLKNTINLIITRSSGLIEKAPLTFEYEKYNITLNNLQILKPFNKDIKITKEINYNNETFLNLESIMITIQSDIFIQLFAQNQEKIKYKKIFFELYFDDIKFKLINNFHTEFSSLKTKSIKHL